MIDRIELAGRLAAADEAERAVLLGQYGDLADVELVRALKALFERTRQSDPPRSAGAAAGARALADTLAGARERPVRTCDPAEAALLSRRDDLREELNWLYSQLRGRSGEGAAATAPMRAALREREDRMTLVTRRVAQRRQVAGAVSPVHAAPSARRCWSALTLLGRW
ncbi:MAG TPA: hypothetical protein VGL23_22020 [Chloroflexota bacterium]